MSYFPTNKDEISLIKFIAKYQYLNVSDAKYFFNSSRYYRNRIKNLIDKNFLRKILKKLQGLNILAYIICNSEVETKLRKELPDANYCVVDLEKYIDKERKYYC